MTKIMGINISVSGMTDEKVYMNSSNRDFIRRAAREEILKADGCSICKTAS